MQRMIVTGGAGFIGSNFVRRALADTTAEVLVFDALTYAGSLESLKDVDEHPRYHFVRGDITDREAVRDTIADFEPDTIVNFAAESHVDRSIDGPGAFVQTNIVGTFELLEAARGFLAERDAEAQKGFRFLHVSTDEVYGSLGEDGAFREDTPYAPNSPYSASKAAADHLVRAYVHTYGLPAVITNCSNNYGPYQFPEKLIPLMILNAHEGRELPVYGDGSNIRDWLYVDDHCVGILRALEGGVAGEKYNLGGDAERSNLQVVERICDLLEQEAPAAENEALRARGAASYRDLITFVADRPGHDWRYAIDASKAKTQLGWSPAHDFEDGLAETVRWYLEHRDWCRAVTEERYDRDRLGLGSEAGNASDDAPEDGAAPAEEA